jgi:8-oxo-dGTP pyrophosphatase MutT (NUDIX family)
MIEQVSTREVYRNNWLVVREDAVRRSDGSPGIFGVVDKPGGVFVIPLQGERVCLVEQYRYTIGQRSWEFPAGTLPNLAEGDPREIAERELMEETGLRAASMTVLGRTAVAPGFSSQHNHIFLATELSQGELDREHEEQDMRSNWFDRADFEKMILSGEIVDSPTIAAYGLLLLHERGSIGSDPSL